MREANIVVAASGLREVTCLRWFVCLAALAWTRVASGQPDDPWIGKRVVLQFDSVLKIGNQVVDNQKLESRGRGGVRNSFRIYRVEKVNAGWLWLKSEKEGAAGWILAAEVIPYDQAVDYYTNQIRANPSDSSRYSSRGHLWKERKEYDLALADYNEAIRLDPGSESAWSNRGLVWDDKKEYDKAIADFTEAIRLDPTYSLAFNNRAWSRYSKKDYDTALADYNEAIRLDPTKALQYTNRGVLWIDKNEYDLAIGDFNEAVRRDPGYARAYANRGNARRLQKDLDKALADYDESIRLDPAYGWARSGRGRVWIEKKEYDKAIADYDESIRLDPEYSWDYFNRGICRGYKQEYDKAIEDYTSAIRREPTNATFFHNRGLAWSNKSDYDKAIADYDEAIRLSPKYSWGLLNRTVAKILARKTDATDDAKKVLEIEGSKGDLSIYAVIFSSFVERFGKNEAKAKELLGPLAAKLDASLWPYPAVRYLRGDLDAAQFLALAVDDDKRTEAHCYLGLDAQLHGEPQLAAEHFRWVREHGTKSFVEYTIALAELDRTSGKLLAAGNEPIRRESRRPVHAPSPPAEDTKNMEEPAKVAAFVDMVVYVPTADVEKRFGKDKKPLADYVSALKKRTDGILTNAKPSSAKGLLVAVGLKTDKRVKVWCQAIDGEMPRALLRTLEQELADLDPVTLLEGPAGFALKFRLNGQSPARFPDVPDRWSDAAESSQSKMIIPPDDLFKILWPD